MAQPKRSASKVLPFKSEGNHVSESGNQAIRIFLSLVAENVSEANAWKIAGTEAFKRQPKKTDDEICHLVSDLRGGYTGGPRNGSMTKTAMKSRPQKATSKAKKVAAEAMSDAKAELPSGNGLKAIVSRGIIRTVDQIGMTVPQAAEHFKMEYRTLYRMMRMNSLTAENTDAFCKASGISYPKLLELGTPEP